MSKRKDIYEMLSRLRGRHLGDLEIEASIECVMNVLDDCLIIPKNRLQIGIIVKNDVYIPDTVTMNAYITNRVEHTFDRWTYDNKLPIHEDFLRKEFIASLEADQ